MADRVLERWVSQPPAAPIVQYLRDAERNAALELLDVDAGDRVLDVASEANVTRDLPGRVTRVDFSPAATDAAQESLGDGLEYVTVAPEEPDLPFEADAFDAAVCVGPYDWRFLDVERLTLEVARVTDGDAQFVVTVPTPRSPYHHGGRWTLRYYTPRQLDALVAPTWWPADETLLYQFRPRTQWIVEQLPARLQHSAVHLAQERSKSLTAEHERGRASYVVSALARPPYREWLDDALDALFRDVPRGFYDPDAGEVVRALDYDAGRNGYVREWSRTESEWQWRYAPMALMGVAQWRASPLGDDRHDDRFRAALDTTRRRIREESPDLPAYGVGPLVAAYALADGVVAEPGEYLPFAHDLYAASRDADFEHAEQSLLLYGWTYLYDALGALPGGESDATLGAESDATPGADVAADTGVRRRLRSDIADGLHAVADRQSAPDGLFAFGNATTRRHQNQMYALWGACRAAEVTGREGYLPSLANVLDHTVSERQRGDGAFRWYDPGRRTRVGARVRMRSGTPQWELLFACHQTFFVDAVAHYYRAGGARRYDHAVGRAMQWIRDAKLHDRTGIGVPMRGCTTDGRFDTPGQQFKGTYEIGALVMALTNLLTWDDW